MGTSTLKAENGRVRILTTLLAAVALLVSLVTFAPLASANGDDNSNGTAPSATYNIKVTKSWEFRKANGNSWNGQKPSGSVAIAVTFGNTTKTLTFASPSTKTQWFEATGTANDEPSYAETYDGFEGWTCEADPMQEIHSAEEGVESFSQTTPKRLLNIHNVCTKDVNWDIYVGKGWVFNGLNPGDAPPAGSATITYIIGGNPYVVTYNTAGEITSGSSPIQLTLPASVTDPMGGYSESYNVPGWTCEAEVAQMAPNDAGEIEAYGQGWGNQNRSASLYLANTCDRIPPPPPPPPTTVPEETTTTTEEVEDTETVPPTTEEIKDAEATPTTVTAQALPKTGNNTTTALSLAGVLITAGAGFALIGRRRFNAGS